MTSRNFAHFQPDNGHGSGIALAAGPPKQRNRLQNGPDVRRIAYSKAETAASLGVSVDTVERYVWPELRVIRFGRLQLVPVVELERWAERNATRWDGG